MKILSIFKNRAFLFYSLLFLVPLFVMGVLFISSLYSASRNADQSFHSTIQSVKNDVDSELESTDKIYSQITLIPKIDSLYTNSSTINEKKLIFIRTLLPTLRAFEETNKRVEKVCLYFPKSDFLISGTGTYDKQTISHWFDSLYKMDKSKLLELAGKRGKASYQAINFSDLGRGLSLVDKRAMIAYIRAIVPSDAQIPPMIVLVFLKQYEFLEDYSFNLPSYFGNISTIDADGTFLFREPPDYLSSKTYDFFMNNMNTLKAFTINHKGDHYKAIAVKSDLAQWNYILSVPESIYLAKTMETINIMLLSFFIYLAISVLILWGFYRFNYRPLHHIADLIKKAREGTPAPGNEYAFIEQSVKNMIYDSTEIKHRFELQKEDAQLGALSLLLQSDENHENLNAEKLNEIGLHFDKRYYFVFIIYPTFQNNEDHHFQGMDIHDELQNWFKNIDHIYIVRSKTSYVCIVNSDMELSFLLARASQFCSSFNLNQSPNDQSPYYYSTAFSRRYQSFHEVRRAYQEASEVKEYKLYWDMEDISLYEDLCAKISTNNFPTGDIDIELQIINHIKSQDFESAITLINKQMNAILLLTFLPLSLIKCRMFGIINLLLSIISEMRSMFDLKFMEEINASEILLNCQSFHDLQVCMNDLFNHMRNYIQQKETALDGSRIQIIMNFVKVNYSDPQMSITYLSQVFSRNESYLSRCFKKYVGIGFLDYLHHIRIVEAKRLIDNGMSIRDVTSKVGYMNEITLIRAFKRYEGITPGKLKPSIAYKNSSINKATR